MDLPIEEYFRYHPPTTDDRKQKHDAVNTAALEFAKVIDACVKDEDCKKMGMFAVQQARMFANQGVTVDELKAAPEWKPEVMPPLPDDPNWMTKLQGDVPAGSPFYDVPSPGAIADDPLDQGTT